MVTVSSSTTGAKPVVAAAATMIGPKIALKNTARCCYESAVQQTNRVSWTVSQWIAGLKRLSDRLSRSDLKRAGTSLCTVAHTKYLRTAGPFSVARLKMGLPFPKSSRVQPRSQEKCRPPSMSRQFNRQTESKLDGKPVDRAVEQIKFDSVCSIK